MFREEKTSTLLEKIDDAIEQAENLGLALVASILKIARLELIQPENGRGLAPEGNEIHESAVTSGIERSGGHMRTRPAY
jgi:hypothetical protein